LDDLARVEGRDQVTADHLSHQLASTKGRLLLFPNINDKNSWRTTANGPDGASSL
jgi:hypothetical protein